MPSFGFEYEPARSSFVTLSISEVFSRCGCSWNQPHMSDRGASAVSTCRVPSHTAATLPRRGSASVPLPLRRGGHRRRSSVLALRTGGDFRFELLVTVRDKLTDQDDHVIDRAVTQSPPVS